MARGLSGFVTLLRMGANAARAVLERSFMEGPRGGPGHTPHTPSPLPDDWDPVPVIGGGVAGLRADVAAAVERLLNVHPPGPARDLLVTLIQSDAFRAL